MPGSLGSLDFWCPSIAFKRQTSSAGNLKQRDDADSTTYSSFRSPTPTKSVLVLNISSIRRAISLLSSKTPAGIEPACLQIVPQPNARNEYYSLSLPRKPSPPPSLEEFNNVARQREKNIPCTLSSKTPAGIEAGKFCRNPTQYAHGKYYSLSKLSDSLGFDASDVRIAWELGFLASFNCLQASGVKFWKFENKHCIQGPPRLSLSSGAYTNLHGPTLRPTYIQSA
ncbi:hypothetical protein B0H16DRAFT_1461500 [Mycena metata]|uniref:Uncharacterized protein n=1 Tax=Mycena metata TaxID=1033252 RepID=A0AAD7ITV9_9AGAR|nr:hypothetical protein B0H16DRAFT_1461500 [Mycena metata]